MYRNFYNFTSMPFETSPDPKFLWLGKKHGEALAAIKYGIVLNKGFISLTGDVGTGKTTIVNALANRLGDNIIFAKIPDPSLKELDFFNFAAKAFEMNKSFSTKGEFLGHLERFLNTAYDKGKKILFVVEEAQRLNPELLEEVRLLSNIEKPNKKLINILFVGQNEFNDLLKMNTALRHRIAVSCRIEPLTEVETEKYILHRLKVAGSESRIFSPSATREIFSFSEGNPRLINFICDLALLSGYVQETKTIESEMIRECTTKVFTPNQKNAEIIKDQKALAKTIKKTGIRELATQKDINQADKENAQPKPVRRKTVYMVSVPLFILICVLGFLFYVEGFNASAVKLKSYLKGSFDIFTSAISGHSVPKLKDSLNQEKNLNIRLQTELSSKSALIADLQQKLESSQFNRNKLEKNRDQEKNRKDALKAELSSKTAQVEDLQQKFDTTQANYVKLESEIAKSKEQTAQLQSQLSDLSVQKTSADNELSQLKARNDVLVTEIEELKGNLQRLETGVERRDQILSVFENKQKDLENAINHQTTTNLNLREQLTSKTALVEDLQQKLNSYQARNVKLEVDLVRNRPEINQLEGQLSDLEAQKTSVQKPPVILEVQEEPPAVDDIPKTEAETSSPGDIIDWVLKNKSE